MASNIDEYYISQEFDSILENYIYHKKNTSKVLDLLGDNYVFNKYTNDDKSNYNALKYCGTHLTFNSDKHLIAANFCRQRICPMCQYRRSIKMFVQMYEVVKVLEDKYRFLHLVLTIPNVNDGKELVNGIRFLYKSYNKLMSYKCTKSTIKGALRCCEVSYNYENDTFHPHLHILLVVPPSYFTDSKRYIKYDKWVELWQKACKSDIPYQVSIRAIKKGDYAGVAEVCKYCVKPLDFNKGNDYQNQRMLLTMWHTCKGMRFMQKYGVLKDTYNQIWKNDNEDDIINIGGEVEDNVEKVEKYIVSYEWNFDTQKYERRICEAIT